MPDAFCYCFLKYATLVDIGKKILVPDQGPIISSGRGCVSAVGISAF